MSRHPVPELVSGERGDGYGWRQGKCSCSSEPAWQLHVETDEGFGWSCSCCGEVSA